MTCWCCCKLVVMMAAKYDLLAAKHRIELLNLLDLTCLDTCSVLLLSLCEVERSLETCLLPLLFRCTPHLSARGLRVSITAIGFLMLNL